MNAKTHTAIMRAIIDNHTVVLKEAKAITRITSGKLPESRDVLVASTKAPGIAASTKKQIEKVLTSLDKVQSARNSLPPRTKAALNEVTKVVNNSKTVQSMIKVLVKTHRSGKYKHIDGMQEGLLFAIEMLRDGESTIYAESYPFNAVYRENAGVKAGKADIAGAIGGAVAGSVVPGAGTAAGAAAGGVGASVASVVQSALDWLF